MQNTDLALLAVVVVIILLILLFRAEPFSAKDKFDVKDLGLFGVQPPTLLRPCDQYNHEPRCRPFNTDLKVL